MQRIVCGVFMLILTSYLEKYEDHRIYSPYRWPFDVSRYVWCCICYHHRMYPHWILSVLYCKDMVKIYGNGNSLGGYLRRHKILLTQKVLWKHGYSVTRKGDHKMLWISPRT